MNKRIIITLILCCCIAIACNQTTKKAKTQLYGARVYQTELSQFGYDILKDDKIIIHQPNIPAIEGNRGFATKEDAMKVAELMIYKLNNNIMPPSVSPTELDSLKISIN